MKLPTDPDHALHATLTALAASCGRAPRRRPGRPAGPPAAGRAGVRPPPSGDERALPDAALLRWYAAGRLGAPAR